MSRIDKDDIKKHVEEICKNGVDKLADIFGLTWEVLSEMENDCPELTSRITPKEETGLIGYELDYVKEDGKAVKVIESIEKSLDFYINDINIMLSKEDVYMFAKHFRII